MSDQNSSVIELAPNREMLRMYCRALSERGVELQDLQQLVDKNIGWSRNDIATSDGAAIFLPSVIERFDDKADNYEFLKVMLTQQAGHIEFGSFDFDFERPSMWFDDVRPKLHRLSEADRRADHDHHGGDAFSPTEFTRFFRLFSNKALAMDIFSVLESARIEARVMQYYRGIAETYKVLRERALALRQEILFLPAREGLIEVMIRLSLGWDGSINVPKQHVELATEIRDLTRLAWRDKSTIEDTAEATLRVYGLLSLISNDFLEEKHFGEIDAKGSNEPTVSRRWNDESFMMDVFVSSTLSRRDKQYLSPQGVDYRGEFKPELAQLLSRPKANAREERQSLTAEQLAELLRGENRPQPMDSEDDEGEEQDPQTRQMVQNLMREVQRRDPRMQSVDKRPWFQSDDELGPLSATQPDTYVYAEWDVWQGQYRTGWCRVYEKIMGLGDLRFYNQTLQKNAQLLRQVRREFEQVAPEIYHKEKRLPDGSDHDLDAAIEALTDLRIGVSPSEKIFWRHHKNERDVAVAFLLDLSGSTGESITSATASAHAFEGLERPQQRIIDVEKEAIVLMADALEAIGDRYAVYGFSGHGRDNVEFYVMKDFAEEFSPAVAKRLGRAGPLHATRMGPAIRHAASKLRVQQTRSKFLFLISDGRPQDRGYSQESSEKAYAVQDTRMALIEARREGITPFCLTVDKEGNDYLRTMMDDFSYEVLADVTLLPYRLPQLYRRLTF